MTLAGRRTTLVCDFKVRSYLSNNFLNYNIGKTKKPILSNELFTFEVLN